MKTKIIIEIETVFNPIYAKDDNDELEMDCPVTERVEKEFHGLIDSAIRQYVEDVLEDDVFEYDSPEYAVEDYDSFLDYGKVSIKVITEEEARK